MKPGRQNHKDSWMAGTVAGHEIVGEQCVGKKKAFTFTDSIRV